jgi:hypothetical protein
MTISDIIELLKGVRWSSFHSWLNFHNVIAPLAASLAGLWRTWIKRRNARLAQDWPLASGRVLSTNVARGTKFFGSVRLSNASFTYSYSVQEGSEVNYLSGNYSRSFSDQERAREWLESLKDKQIRVHVKPGRPEVSAVLDTDLDAHFPLPVHTPADLLNSAFESHLK